MRVKGVSTPEVPYIDEIRGLDPKYPLTLCVCRIGIKTYVYIDIKIYIIIIGIIIFFLIPRTRLCSNFLLMLTGGSGGQQ